ncbi:MAG: acetyl-CoA C-acyltransferase [Polynucleobacter sp.]|uniref:acetyl-CoA C-acyltransferase n=1 Tax=Polynucleobacter sp. TaxID=2029855 RepID=UPI0027222ED5|nr:acetyl-CoA C-acyltransferase [Polynucleobacter sp.]MDO8713480.1 acetyl-CoA C-acyltransferase [Polynucleobacter sp.]
MLNTLIYAGIRTPFGRLAGSLAHTRPDDLLAATFQALMNDSKVDPQIFDDVIIGCANQAGEDSRTVSRQASLLAGLPIELGATVINRNCGSGLGAVIAAAHAITAGEGNVIMTGGVESMSRGPFVMAKAESAFSRDIKVFDSAVGARFPNPKIEKLFGNDSMPQTADNLAVEYGLSREQVDQFVVDSQSKYANALAGGYFDGEIYSVPVPGKKKGEVMAFSKDEQPRSDASMKSLSAMRPLNKDGVTTAASSSSINDGAVALIVGSAESEGRIGLKPIAKILASAVVGVPPRIMGIGPVPAALKALNRAGLTLKDMDVIEINEAFAAQALSCIKGLGMNLHDERVNPNGGAIAIGHPLGASGPRILLTAARQLQRTGGRYALVAMCIGMGQGIAVVIERA